MQFDVESLSAADRYELLLSTVVPRPIALITTLSADGSNAATCAINTLGLKLIGGMHGARWYARTSDLFAMDRPTWAQWVAAGKVQG